MTDQSQTIRMVPLADLYLHPLNPRQSVPDDDIRAMAQSLASAGLLQNLCGIEDQGRIGIVAGGRRLRGLKLLAAEGAELPLIPVQLAPDATTARAWALAENVTHAALHPAEEIRAYGQQAAHGVPVESIARAFAKTERHVRQRLKLAGLPAEVLDLLAADRLGLSAAEALCLTEDPERQIALAQTAAVRNLSAAQIRAELTAAAVPASDRRAVFLGLADYEARGGRISRDLFTEDAFLEDPALLEELWTEKLIAETERLRAEEGWAWAEHDLDAYMPWSRTEKLDRITPPPVDLPEGDAAELERLQALPWQERSEEDDQRIEALRARMVGDFTDDQRASGGIITYVDREGALIIERAFARKTRGRARDGGGDQGGAAAKPALPQNARDDLRCIAHAALQTALIDQTELLLDLLAWQIEAKLPPWAGALGVTLATPSVTPEKDSSFHLDARLPEPGVDHRAETSWNAFAAFREKGKKHRNQVLARALARSAHGTTNSGFPAALAEHVEARRLIRKIWTPDAANYFGRIRPDVQVAIWEELTSAEGEELKRFADLKKADRAKELEALFSDASTQEALGLSRDQVKTIDAWLPEEMRHGQNA